MKRAIKISLFWVRAVAFLCILFCVSSYMVYVLTPKHDYGICPIVNYYNLPEDTVDVLILGSSLGYAGVNTNILWEEYGIAAYNLCGAEQPYWVTRYYLEEALKTQTPKLIIIDAKASTYHQQEYCSRGRTILATFGIRDLGLRYKAIKACVAPENVMGYVLAWPQIHINYTDMVNEIVEVVKLRTGHAEEAPAEEQTEEEAAVVTLTPQETLAQRFTFPPNNGGRGSSWKGYIEYDISDEHQKPSVAWTNNMRMPMMDRQRQYLEETLALANEAGIPVLVIGIPNADYANDHLYYNDFFAIAEDYGATAINYNKTNDREVWPSETTQNGVRLKITFSTDCADWQHLNVNGSVKFSFRLGKDILKVLAEQGIELTDHRGDEKYASYDECAEAWFEKYPTYSDYITVPTSEELVEESVPESSAKESTPKDIVEEAPPAII